MSRRSLLLRLLVLSLAAASTAASPDPGVATAQPAVREVSLTGFTRARAALRLVAERPGRVEEVFYDIGGTIGEDGVFARLDDTFIRLELDEVKVQQDRLNALIDYDQREVKRYRELARQNNASASQLDTLEQTLRNNSHELRALEVKQRVLEERLTRTRIRAPAGWRVTGRAVEPGQWVKDGEVVGEAADFSTLLVPFALTPEQHAALTARGDGIRLRLPDLDRQVDAGIYRANPAFDPTTRKIAVDLQIRGEIESRRGGLRVQLPLLLPERTGTVMLPAAAVERSYEEFWVTREDGARLRVMLLGRSHGEEGERLRIASPEIKAGERFRLVRED
ncbi:MAG: efflux RND transporter periplasmic adaptor subunit [Pseudomonadota bacterium]|nr:efflux RND transporter periplasmic adaptor subunit [Pseudomonadota bacterium]